MRCSLADHVMGARSGPFQLPAGLLLGRAALGSAQTALVGLNAGDDSGPAKSVPNGR